MKFWSCGKFHFLTVLTVPDKGKHDGSTSEEQGAKNLNRHSSKPEKPASSTSLTKPRPVNWSGVNCLKAAAYFSAVSHEADWEWLWKDDEIRHAGCSPDNNFKIHLHSPTILANLDRPWKITTLPLEPHLPMHFFLKNLVPAPMSCHLQPAIQLK